MYLVDFELLKSLKLTNDHLKIGSLKRIFELGVTMWYNNRYQQCFVSLDDSKNRWHSNVLLQIQ
jgi:hypothetical protein